MDMRVAAPEYGSIHLNYSNLHMPKVHAYKNTMFLKLYKSYKIHENNRKPSTACFLRICKNTPMKIYIKATFIITHKTKSFCSWF